MYSKYLQNPCNTSLSLVGTYNRLTACKKRAYSLAEVFIAIIVVGAIAILLLSMTARNRQHELNAKLDKTESTIASILEQQNLMQTGRDANTFRADNLYELFKEKLDVANECSNNGDVVSSCWADGADGAYADKAMVLTDKTAVALRDVGNENMGVGGNIVSTHIFIDANGPEAGPNKWNKDIRSITITFIKDTNKLIYTHEKAFGECLCEDGTACPYGNPAYCTNNPSNRGNCKCENGNSCPSNNVYLCPDNDGKRQGTCTCKKDNTPCPYGQSKYCPVGDNETSSSKNKCVCPNGKSCNTASECNGKSACKCKNGSNCPDDDYNKCPENKCDLKCPSGTKHQEGEYKSNCECVCNPPETNETYDNEIEQEISRSVNSQNNEAAWTKTFNSSTCEYNYTCSGAITRGKACCLKMHDDGKTKRWANDTGCALCDRPSMYSYASWNNPDYGCEASCNAWGDGSDWDKPIKNDLGRYCCPANTTQPSGNNQKWGSGCNICSKPNNSHWDDPNGASCNWSCDSGYVKNHKTNDSCITVSPCANGQISGLHSSDNNTTVLTVPAHDSNCVCWVNGTSPSGTGGFNGKYKLNGVEYSYNGWCSTGSDWHRNSQCIHKRVYSGDQIIRVSGSKVSGAKSSESGGELELKCYTNTMIQQQNWSYSDH